MTQQESAIEPMVLESMAISESGIIEQKDDISMKSYQLVGAASSSPINRSATTARSAPSILAPRTIINDNDLALHIRGVFPMAVRNRIIDYSGELSIFERYQSAWRGYH